MTNHEQYLFKTVRIKFDNKLNIECDRVGIVYEVTRNQMTLLALDDEQDVYFIVDREKIDKIEIPEL